MCPLKPQRAEATSGGGRRGVAAVLASDFTGVIRLVGQVARSARPGVVFQLQVADAPLNVNGAAGISRPLDDGVAPDDRIGCVSRASAAHVSGYDNGRPGVAGAGVVIFTRVVLHDVAVCVPVAVGVHQVPGTVVVSGGVVAHHGVVNIDVEPEPVAIHAGGLVVSAHVVFNGDVV